MISVATGGDRIQNVDSRYKTLHSSMVSRCKKVNIKYENSFAGLWDWYARWGNDFPHYQERRQFINQLLAPTFDDLPLMVMRNPYLRLSLNLVIGTESIERSS